MNELQALVTGMLMGLANQRSVDLTVIPEYDAEGNYLPEFVVLGNVSGTKLRIKIEVEDGP